jgi:hypothetical protein
MLREFTSKQGAAIGDEFDGSELATTNEDLAHLLEVNLATRRRRRRPVALAQGLGLHPSRLKLPGIEGKAQEVP